MKRAMSPSPRAASEESAANGRQRGLGGSRKGHRIRLYHHKSRAGCRRCKDRRVKVRYKQCKAAYAIMVEAGHRPTYAEGKRTATLTSRQCDEETPSCTACQRHNVKCVYEDAAQPPPHTIKTEATQQPLPQTLHVPQDAYLGPLATSAASPTPSTATDDLVSLHTTRIMRRAEFHFIHNYIVNIAYTPQNPRTGLLDPKHFPDLFHFLSSSDNILYSVFAASANHLIVTGGFGDGVETFDAPSVSESGFKASSLPSEVAGNMDWLIKVRDDYLCLALKEQREAIANLSTSNINSICFAGMVIMMTELALLRDRSLEPYEPPLKWLQMGRGVGTVVTVGDQQMQALDPHWSKGVVDGANPQLDNATTGGEALARMGQMGTDLLIPTGFPGDDLHEPGAFNIYQYVVKYIGTMLLAIDRGAMDHVIGTKLGSFGAWVEPDFILYVSQRRPRALILLAHLFNVVRPLTGTWWFRGIAPPEIAAIWHELTPEWQTLMPEDSEMT